MADELGPVMAPRGDSPAVASQPTQELDPRHQTYESHPVPWWIAVLWLGFLVGGATYLVVNLSR